MSAKPIKASDGLLFPFAPKRWPIVLIIIRKGHIKRLVVLGRK